MKRKFPMPVKRGNVTVKIYRQKARGYVSFTVAHRDETGRLERATFSKLAEAGEYAGSLAERLNSGNGLPLVLDGPDRMAYTRAIENLAPMRVPLDVATSEYAQAVQLLEGRASLAEAVRCFVKRQGGQIVAKKVQEVVDELIATREKDGSSHCHVEDLRSRLNRFAESFHCDIATLTAADIQDFLLGLKLAPKTVNNFRTAISNLFSFARLKRYFPKDENPVAEVPEVKEPERDIGIYTPAELQLLLQHAPSGFVAYLVIAAFAGLRQSEIARLEWSHVGPDYIRVPGGERRTKSKRLVRLQPNLQQWMAQLRQPSGKVVPFANVSNEVVDVCKKAGVTSKHNGLRHSFGSYRTAILQDPAKVAHEMGNSARIVAKHYLEFVTEEQARAWFNIAPEQLTNLVTVNVPCLEAQVQAAAQAAEPRADSG
jgi:integrase